MDMFKLLGITAFIVGFTVPYLSVDSMGVATMIALQIAFYATGYVFFNMKV